MCKYRYIGIVNFWMITDTQLLLQIIRLIYDSADVTTRTIL